MNNQEAITLLRNLEDSLDSYCGLNEEGKTAFRMAIEALSYSKIPNNSDTINRQAAIDAIRAYLSDCCVEDGDYHASGIEYELNDLPSIQPECPKGRWIPTASEKGRHECSRCHEYAPCYQDGSEHLSTFCVLCGAKMEEGK